MPQEQINSPAPQVVFSFFPSEEFDAPVYNPSLTLYHCKPFFKKKAWLQWRKIPRKEHERERQRWRCRRGQRRKKDQLVQEVVRCVKREEKEGLYDGEKHNVQRVEQSFMRSWDCSRIENGEEEETWREVDQMAAQWEEVQKLEEIVEQGSSFAGGAHAKGTGACSARTYEPNFAVVEDTGEMRKRRGFKPDLRWKNLAG